MTRPAQAGVDWVRGVLGTVLDEVAAAEAAYCLGHADDFDPAQCYARHPALTSPAAVRGLLDTTAVLAVRRFTRLLVDQAIAARTRNLRAEITAAEQTVRLDLGTHGSRTLREAERLAAEHPDLAAATEAAFDRHVAPLRERLLRLIAVTVADYGFPTVAAYTKFAAGYDIAALHDEAEEYLLRTRTLFDEMLGRQGIRRGQARLTRLLRFVPECPAADWRPEACLQVIRATAQRLGLDPGGVIRFDLDSRPGKVAGSYCLPVRVPQDIVVVVSPQAGPEDWRVLLHETGHAWHFASTPAELPVESRRLGDPGLVEGWGAVTEHLLLDPVWRSRAFREDPDGLGRQFADRMLTLGRFQSARFIYEYEVLTGGFDATNARRRYWELITGHLGAVPAAGDNLRQMHTGLVPGTRLRSWRFATAVRGALAEMFGPHWTYSRQAGAWLADRWGEGQPTDADAALGRWGLERGSLAAYHAQLAAAIRSPRSDA